MNKTIRNEEELLIRYRNGERDFQGYDLDDRIYHFENKQLENVNFSGSYIFATFESSNLCNANFSNANIKTCNFKNANLSNAVFHNALLDGTTFEGAILNGADFEGAEDMKKGEVPNW
jgi:uncharacterized protein YjbI with pentapeptide repeats